MKSSSQMIEMNPKVMLGKPVIKGTRITVESILDKLASGETYEDILKAHSHLTHDQILAALAFAAESLKDEVVYPISE